MVTKIAAGAAALLIGAAVLAYAQQPPVRPSFDLRPQLSAEDRAALLDARVAGLHAGLRLNADQEKNWPAFEQAMRGLAAQRRDSGADPQAEASDPIERTKRAADRLGAFSTALKQYADAAAPLYQTFDDGQKRRFRILSRIRGPGFGGFSREDRAERRDFRDGRPGPRPFGGGRPEGREPGDFRGDRRGFGGDERGAR